MPKRENQYNSIATEYIMEVFDWAPGWPEYIVGEAGGSVTAGEFSGATSLGAGFEPGKLILPAPYLPVAPNPPAPTLPSPSNPFVLPANDPFPVIAGGSGVVEDQNTVTFGNQQFIDAIPSETIGPNTGIKTGYASSFQKGMISIAFQRTKKNINSQCVVKMAGPLPSCIRAGNWVIISSIFITPQVWDVDGTDQSVATPQILPKFIGQIATVLPTYTTQASGNIVQETVIQIDEWSYCLSCPVLFDLMASANLITTPNANAGVAFGVSKQNRYKKLSDLIIKKAFNPYQMAELFLSLIGALNTQEGGVGWIVSGKPKPAYAEQNAWDISTNMPSIPKTLLSRLGFDTNVTKPDDAFSTGFAKLINGRQNTPYHSDAIWDGVFGEDEIEDFKSLHDQMESNFSSQPTACNIASLGQIGHSSAWQLISNFCDPGLNEAFTDVLYEEDEDTGQIQAQPVIFVRAKPFLSDASLSTGKVKDTALLKDWPKYEDVPRITIPSGIILGFSPRQSCRSSPNFIKPVYDGQGVVGQEYEKQMSIMQSVCLDGEGRRFGGQILNQHSMYYDNVDPLKWAKTKIALGIAWFSDNYKMAEGTLTIKDHSIPLTLGFNIQFDFGQYALLAHIESISSIFSMNAQGVRESTTTIEFSRLMMIDENEGVQFLDAGAIVDLFGIS